MVVWKGIVIFVSVKDCAVNETTTLIGEPLLAGALQEILHGLTETVEGKRLTELEKMVEAVQENCVDPPSGFVKLILLLLLLQDKIV